MVEETMARGASPLLSGGQEMAGGRLSVPQQDVSMTYVSIPITPGWRTPLPSIETTRAEVVLMMMTQV